jgi:hypothetical protein
MMLQAVAENKSKKSLINLTHECLVSVYVDGYAMGIKYKIIMFELATDTTISCTLDRRYQGE